MPFNLVLFCHPGVGCGSFTLDLVVAGDVKVAFFCHDSESLPASPPASDAALQPPGACVFYACFNTAFVTDMTALLLPRAHVDRAHKQKHLKHFAEKFALQFNFAVGEVKLL